ncbi:DUF2637 domain-containing protein [Streptomyces sp. NPDC058268]|uniref:DUF2637 domain-containing protein n=1 Tax=Streptomyces sp. NPDC058268 TaxID=3346413 RepID=UPI0036ED8292
MSATRARKRAAARTKGPTNHKATPKQTSRKPMAEQAAKANQPDAPVRPETGSVLADVAELRAQAADDVARILADAEAQAAELLDGARTQGASIIEAAAAEQARILAGAKDDADQVRTEAAATASAKADQVHSDAKARAGELLADARREADNLTTTAAAKAEQIRTEATQAAARILTDAQTTRTELLAGAEHTAAETRTRANTDAEQVLLRARGEADRMRENTDEQAAQVRAAAERTAAGLRQDAKRALADARTSADELRDAAVKDANRLREQAEAVMKTSQEAAEKAAVDQAAGTQTREEGERILADATKRTVQRARRREIRTESRNKRRQARPVGGVPPLSGKELVGAVAIVLAAAAVSTLGLLSSYTALETKAAGWGWEWPWLLPVGIDVAIPAFTGASLFLIRLGMELRWIRWVPRVLTAVSVYLNWSASDSTAGRLGHAALTLLWVVFSEIASHVYATRIGAVTGKKRMETVRRSRWLLAPIPTARLRRRMILWEITSYEEALTRLQEQTYLRAQLREKYGRGWRSKAPLKLRMALKLGEAPAALADTLTPEDTLTVERAEESEHAHPDMSALTSGEMRGERERPVLISGAHEGERATDNDDAHRAESARTRRETDALTERRHARIRLLYTELGRRPEWTEIRDALTDAELSDTPVSRPTAQRLRAQVEEAAPGA